MRCDGRENTEKLYGFISIVITLKNVISLEKKRNSYIFEMQHDLHYFYGPISCFGLLVSTSALYEFNACTKNLIETGIK